MPPRRLTRSFLRKDLDRRAARGEPSPRSPSYPSAWLARRGRLEGAEQLAREGVKVAANSEFVVLHADVLLDLAEVLELAGRPEGARAAAIEAVSVYERKGNLAAATKSRALVSAA